MLTVGDSSSSSSLYQALPFGVPGTGPIGPGRARHAVWGSAIWRASFAYGSALSTSHTQSMLLTETSFADTSLCRLPCMNKRTTADELREFASRGHRSILQLAERTWLKMSVSYHGAELHAEHGRDCT